jgi:hypothetical protein
MKRFLAFLAVMPFVGGFVLAMIGGGWRPFLSGVAIGLFIIVTAWGFITLFGSD